VTYTGCSSVHVVWCGVVVLSVMMVCVCRLDHVNDACHLLSSPSPPKTLNNFSKAQV